MANEQTVADKPDGQASDNATKPDADAGNDARKPDDLDALLDSFKPSEQQRPADKSSDTTTDADKGNDAAAKRLEALERTIAEDRFQQAITPVIKTVRGDIPEDVWSDAEIRDWIDGEANRDPRLREAWQQRSDKPKQFDRVVKALSDKFASKFKRQPDARASEDRDAVTDAVRRGASTKPDPGSGKGPDYSRLGDREFADKVEKEHGFRPF